MSQKCKLTPHVPNEPKEEEVEELDDENG